MKEIEARYRRLLKIQRGAIAIIIVSVVAHFEYAVWHCECLPFDRLVLVAYPVIFGVAGLAALAVGLRSDRHLDTKSSTEPQPAEEDSPTAE